MVRPAAKKYLYTMRRLAFSSLLTLVALASCNRDLLDPRDLHITASPEFLFPLAHVNLDLDDVLPVDTTGPLTVTDQPYYVIAYTLDSLAQISAADLLQIPTQAPVALSAPLGVVALPDLQSSATVTLGALSANISNPSNFGSSMASAHGSNAPFPALPTQNPGALNSISLGTIQSADFASGSMVMQLVNGFPAAMSATVALADAQGTELLTFAFSNVAAGDSATDGQDLSGLSLPGTLTVVLKNVSSPGAGTPGIPSTYVAIDTTDALALSILGSGMTVRSATASLATQTVVDSALWMGFAAPAGVEITEIGMLTGQLDYSITSGFPEDVSVTFSLPGSSVNGGPAWAQTLTILKNSNIFGAFPWAGLSLDLTQDSAQPFNQLPLAYEVTLLGSGQPVTMDSSQTIAFNFTINNLGMDYVYGFFGQESISLPTDTIALSFPALDRLQGSIVFTEPSLSVIVENQTNTGIPVTVDLDLVSIKPDGTSVPLSSSPTLFNYPVLTAQMGQNSSAALTLDASNSNMVDVLSWPKTGVAFGGQVAYNLDTATTGRFNYISHTSGMKVGAQFTLPFALTASGLSFTDSVDVSSLGSQLQSDTSVAVAAQLSIHSISHFPVDAALHLLFYDEMGQVVWTEDVPLVHSATVDPATGYVTQPTAATDVLTLDSVAMEQIAQAKWLELEATLETAGGGQDPVKLQAGNGLELHLGMQVEFEKVIL
jgi:hypothetical protein